MSRKNFAAKHDTDARGLRLEKAAEDVSNDLDKVIHERLRLGIISALAANERLNMVSRDAIDLRLQTEEEMVVISGEGAWWVVWIRSRRAAGSREGHFTLRLDD